jgi:hypothetical protein
MTTDPRIHIITCAKERKEMEFDVDMLQDISKRVYSVTGIPIAIANIIAGYMYTNTAYMRTLYALITRTSYISQEAKECLASVYGYGGVIRIGEICASTGFVQGAIGHKWDLYVMYIDTHTNMRMVDRLRRENWPVVSPYCSNSHECDAAYIHISSKHVDEFWEQIGDDEIGVRWYGLVPPELARTCIRYDLFGNIDEMFALTHWVLDGPECDVLLEEDKC